MARLRDSKIFKEIVTKIMENEWILANDDKDTDENIQERIRNNIIALEASVNALKTNEGTICPLSKISQRYTENQRCNGEKCQWWCRNTENCILYSSFYDMMKR